MTKRTAAAMRLLTALLVLTAARALAPSSLPAPKTMQPRARPYNAPAARARSLVQPIRSEEEFAQALQRSSTELVVIKFFASWCRACKTIEPKFKRLSQEFGGAASFYEVEFSANKDLCKRLEIKKLPAAQLYTEDGLVDTVVCGPSKFPEVRVAIESCLDEPHADDVPEFTDVSDHYGN